MGASTVGRVVISLEIAEHLRRWTEEVGVALHSDALVQEKTPIEGEVVVGMVGLPRVEGVVPSMGKAEKEAAVGAVVHLPDMVVVGVGEVDLAEDGFEKDQGVLINL